MNLATKHARGVPTKGSHKSIFEELLNSGLPPQEKTIDRLSEEGFIVILAGGDVSAMNLSMLTYRLLAQPDILKTLTDELDTVMTDRDSSPSWQELEKLPFLVGFLVFHVSLQETDPASEGLYL